MQTILKVPIPFKHFGEPFTMNLPHGAKILSVQVQGGVPMAWALAVVQLNSIAKRYVVFGTGQDVPTDVTHMDFIATWQIESMVFHLFRAPL